MTVYPYRLIEAFHSTLEETIFSDLIILILDLSEPMEKIEKKLDVCNETIDRLGASGIPTITALNKIDLISEAEINQKLEALKDKIKNPILLSAKCRTNLDLLREEILRILEKYVQAQFSCSANQQRHAVYFLGSWKNRSQKRRLHQRFNPSGF